MWCARTTGGGENASGVWMRGLATMLQNVLHCGKRHDTFLLRLPRVQHLDRVRGVAAYPISTHLTFRQHRDVP
ncbi:MAG: hypothetical protein GFH27_549287n412 [Chloroflexi bacterium AL-W]|nr:hypothetical protein [Chloroflexi bacterium AL-N1]NOK66686.1 hypothetical protein [Chloroflexi bacterium AL-N10]NOK72074.1 hypothetical protein [Chloroflexi bacterium AL-N5]NOK81331.1 hypothetical protein [Chloroflexi bacterium AL-W]NOK89604.1 hypothetical protein [Chloroflexi bacterium AL-N15]